MYLLYIFYIERETERECIYVSIYIKIYIARKVPANQPDIAVGDKQKKETVVIDKSQQHQEEGIREPGEVPGTERGTGEDMEGEGQSGSSGDRSTRSCKA